MSSSSAIFAFLFLALTRPISVVAVVCKCQGIHCASDVCQGDYCVATLIQAGSKVRKRWEEEPTQLYVRGCAFFASYSLSYADLMNSCFEYDESETEGDKRKICICSARLCNDGPLINASVNHFRQRTCDSEKTCKGEFCLVHQGSPFQTPSIHCANRTLPFFDHILLGLSLSPALAPTILTFPGQLDRSVSLLHSEQANHTLITDRQSDNGLVECPTMFARIEHRDDPEVCIAPKYGSCRGRLCVDIWFNATTFRGHVLERRYRGCILDMDDEYRPYLESLASSGSCVVFESPAANVTACLNGVGTWRTPGHFLFVLALIFSFLTHVHVFVFTN